MERECDSVNEVAAQRRREILAYLQRRENEKAQLADRLTSLQSQLTRTSAEPQRGRLREQIRAREEQLNLAAEQLEREKSRVAEIFERL